MIPAAALFAAVAMIPAMCGPLAAPAASLDLALCGGGATTVPLRNGPGLPATEPCCAKGCHSSRKRATRCVAN